MGSRRLGGSMKDNDSLTTCHKCGSFIFSADTLNCSQCGEPRKLNMENLTYYKLESNDDKGYIIVGDLNTVSELIELDLSDVHPIEIEDLVYTITPIRMTEEEFRNLPENEDW